MTTIEADAGGVARQDPVISEARKRGYELATRLTDTGQVVWEWQRGDEPRPQFVTERVARRWMSDWLARDGA